MRKYYKPVNIRKRDVTAQLSTHVDAWALLDSFMRGARSQLDPELTSLYDKCASTKSVSGYLELSRCIDRRTQSYSPDVDPSTVWCERQLGTLLKKYPFLSSESDLVMSPRANATKKWTDAEVRCKNTNDRLSTIVEGPSWLPRARQLAARILGDLSPSLVINIISDGFHGPGSTRSSHGNRTSAYYKFADLPYTCTKRALPYAYAAITSDPKWMEYIRQRISLPTIPIAGASTCQVQLMYLTRAIEVEDSDKITFVPKDCQTDRPIAVGSSMNLFLQLGVKSYFEERLALFGIDLTDQTKNQKFAHLGALWCMRDGLLNENQFSTVDLASASDTISTELVRKILPSDWFAFLSDLRHDTGLRPDGEVHVYEKFSAMGNGYTFPLESLLFFCICKSAIEESGYACTPNDITVFGDDIIIRHRHLDTVLAALEWSGFEVNSSKSFFAGPFKESCGADYFLGVNVRPFYLKRRIRTREDVYFVANSVLRIFSQSDLVAPGLITMYEYLVSLVPEQYRSYGPMDGDSSYLNTPFQEMCRRSTRPFLSSEEIKAANQAHMLGDVFQHSPVVVRTLTVPIQYRARSDILYLIRLRELSGITSYEWVNGSLKIKSNSVNYATRRESTRRDRKSVV